MDGISSLLSWKLNGVKFTACVTVHYANREKEKHQTVILSFFYINIYIFGMGVWFSLTSHTHTHCIFLTYTSTYRFSILRIVALVVYCILPWIYLCVWACTLSLSTHHSCCAASWLKCRWLSLRWANWTWRCPPSSPQLPAASAGLSVSWRTTHTHTERKLVLNLYEPWLL